MVNRAAGTSSSAWGRRRPPRPSMSPSPGGLLGVQTSGTQPRGNPPRPARDGRYPVAGPTTRSSAPADPRCVGLHRAFDRNAHPLDTPEEDRHPAPAILGGLRAITSEAVNFELEDAAPIVAPRVGSRVCRPTDHRHIKARRDLVEAWPRQLSAGLPWWPTGERAPEGTLWRWRS